VPRRTKREQRHDQHRSRQQNHQDLRADQRQPGQPVHAGGGQREAGVERRHRQQVVAGEESVPPDEVEQRAEVERLLGAGGHQRVAEHGLGPSWLTGWVVGEAPPQVVAPLRIVGAVLVLVGASALLHAFGRFVLEGLGTPAPVAPRNA
jgi:hypothetical protein